MLRRTLIALGAILVVVLAVVGYLFYRFLSTHTVTIDERFSVVLGGGGNAVLVGDDGVLVVDTKFAAPARALAAIVASITTKPVKVIINTHYHFDHTHGNVIYPNDADILAQRRTREHMIGLDQRFWEYEPAWSMLPDDLVDDQREIRFGEETVRILHPGRGHTDGDVVVHFVTRGIIHTGDLFVRDLYPYVDLRGGGSGLRWPATLDAVLAIPNVKLYIPGHGPVSTRADVERFRSYLQSLVSQVQEHAARGRSLSEIQRAVDLHVFDDFQGMPFLTSRNLNVTWVYEEITQKKR